MLRPANDQRSLKFLPRLPPKRVWVRASDETPPRQLDNRRVGHYPGWLAGIKRVVVVENDAHPRLQLKSEELKVPFRSYAGQGVDVDFDATVEVAVDAGRRTH